MANGGVLAASIVIGFLILIGMHWYYPENVLTQVVEKASLKAGMESEFAMGSVVSFSVGLVIEYTIVVLAVFFFLRSIVNSFSRKF